MKNLGFNGDEVMNEYVKLMTPMTKVAAEVKRELDDAKQFISSFLSTYPFLLGLYTSGQTNNWRGVAQEISYPKFAMVNLSKAIKAEVDAMTPKSDELVKEYDKLGAIIKSKIKGAEKVIPVIKAGTEKPMESAESTEPVVKTQSLSARDSVKTAKSPSTDTSLYDVSGETGEDLVETAHPGGGTKTEVGSKTTENLVETIVEQQEADIAAVNKKPTGAYAMINSLYNELSKMGYDKHLWKLAEHLKKKSNINDELVALANKLDERGLTKIADKIDMMLEKVADEGGGFPMSSPTRADPVGGYSSPSWFTPEQSGYSSPSWFTPEQTSVVPKEEKLYSEQPPETQKKPEIKKVWYSDPTKLSRFQNLYNKTIVGKPMPKEYIGFPARLKTDGKIDPDTKKVLDAAGSAGGWKAFTSALARGIGGTVTKQEVRPDTTAFDWAKKLIVNVIAPELRKQYGSESVNKVVNLKQMYGDLAADIKESMSIDKFVSDNVVREQILNQLKNKYIGSVSKYTK
jgi:hypothetical protein